LSFVSGNVKPLPFSLVHFERSVSNQFRYTIVTTVQVGCSLMLFIGNWLGNYLDI